MQHNYLPKGLIRENDFKVMFDQGLPSVEKRREIIIKTLERLETEDGKQTITYVLNG